MHQTRFNLCQVLSTVQSLPLFGQTLETFQHQTFSLLLACSPAPGTDPDADATTILDYDADLPTDFPLSVGHYWPAGADFSALEPGQDMEIVQGIQGGVHTEIALELDLGFDYADTVIVYFDLHIQTLLDGEEVVADLQLDGFKAGNMGFGVFLTQTLPVIFEQNEAVHYEGRDAVIVALVTLEGGTSGHAASVHLVDTRNDLDDLE